MRKEVSAPVMAVIVIVFVAVVAALGWYMINRPGAKPVTDVEREKMGSKTIGAGSQNGGAGKPVKDMN